MTTTARQRPITLLTPSGVLAALPMLVLFFVTMRTFIAGLTSGAVKG